MDLKSLLNESFSKEYAYRVKIAHDCNDDTMAQLEKCMAKYSCESIAPWHRLPIQENPVEFVRAKGVEFVSEVCSTDIVCKYPVNTRMLEVWIATNLDLNHERVLVMDVREPRRIESEMAEERMARDVDRDANMDEALLVDEDQAHYEAQNEWAGEDIKDAYYGEAYNKKFLEELARIKAEKGADYFRRYPSKDELMGDNLRPTWDALNNGVNQGHGAENGKQVSTVDQNLGGP